MIASSSRVGGRIALPIAPLSCTRVGRSTVAATALLVAALLPVTTLAASGPAVITTIGLGTDAHATAFAVAVNPNSGRTYVTPGFEIYPPSACESQIVSVIDNATRTVLAPITVGLSPFGVAVNPKTNKIYVANAGGALCTSEHSDTVSVIDGSTDTVDKTITLRGKGPSWVAINPRTNKVYVTISGGCCAIGHSVGVIDGATDSVLGYVRVDANPFIAAVNPRTNLLYVTHAGADEITVIDGSTDTVLATFSIGSEARGIAFDGPWVYVAARTTNQLAVVDSRTNTVVQTIPVGSRPHGVLYADGRIYVTNRGGCNATPGTVSVIDAATRTVINTVEVGSCPRFLGRDQQGLIYVPNAYTSRSVSVIQP